MGFFDFTKPSYNFAKNIKLVLDKVGVDTSKNNIISGEKILLIHESISDILTGFSRISQDLNIDILKDIKVYLSVGFYTEYYKNETIQNYEEKKYFLHVFDDRKLIFSEFLKFDKNRNISNEEQIKIFENLESNIVTINPYDFIKKYKKWLLFSSRF